MENKENNLTKLKSKAIKNEYENEVLDTDIDNYIFNKYPNNKALKKIKGAEIKMKVNMEKNANKDINEQGNYILSTNYTNNANSNSEYLTTNNSRLNKNSIRDPTEKTTKFPIVMKNENNLNTFFYDKSSSKYVNSKTLKNSSSKNVIFPLSGNSSEDKVKIGFLRKIENKIDYENFKLKTLQGEESYNMLENFILKGKYSNLLHHNNIDNQFYKTNYASTNSLNIFYEKYAKHNEFVRKNVIKKETPSFKFISEVKSKFKVPFPLGLISKHGDEQVINLTGYATGNEHVNILGNSISCSNQCHVKKLNLSQNRLTFYGTKTLLSTITNNTNAIKSIRRIDLSNNNLGANSGKIIGTYILNPSCMLSELILENTNISDHSVKEIANGIVNGIAEYLNFINLGKNSLSDNIVIPICQILESCESSLISLELHENNLTNLGASDILKQVGKSQLIKNLNLSFNKIGDKYKYETSREELYVKSDPLRTEFRNFDIIEFTKTANMIFKDIKLPDSNEDKKGSKKQKTPDVIEMRKFQKKLAETIPEKKVSQFAITLGELFSSKKFNLMHLDISYNNINYIDCLHLEETVKQNHTLLGIHVDGNDMTIDSLGFIHACKNNEYSKYQLHYETEFNKPNNNFMIGNNLIKTKFNKKMKNKNNCWICGNWRETIFALPFSEENMKELRDLKKEKNDNLANDKINMSKNNTSNLNKNVSFQNNMMNTLSNVGNITNNFGNTFSSESNNNESINNKESLNVSPIKLNNNKIVNENNKKENIEDNNEPLKCNIYLDFHDFKGHEMQYRERECKYISFIMCPPGDITYFYAINDKTFIDNEDDYTKHLNLFTPLEIVSIFKC